MSLTSGICSLFVALVALAGSAAASVHDVVFAVRKIELHVRPGEAAPVLGHADEGDELEVVGFQGRWLRVRNGKQVGWVTRTEVAESKPAAPRTGRQRSGFSDKPVTDAVKVTVEIDNVRGFDDPRTKRNNVLNLLRGDVLTVVGHGHDGWLLVQADDGAVGWIPASAVNDAGRFEADPRRAPSEVAKAQPATAPAGSAIAKTQPATAPAGSGPAVATTEPRVTESRSTEIRVAESRSTPRWTGMMLAGGGAQNFKMAQSGQGDGMAIANGAVAVIAARAQVRVSRSIWVGASTDMEIGSAGLTYYAAAPAAPSASMSTRELDIDGHAELGVGRLPYLAVRGGVHYATLSVKSDRDEPMLIGERIGGPTVGLAGALPIPLGRFWLSAAVDAMPAGAQKLDRFPAGTLRASAVKGVWAHTTLAMPLPMHLMLALSYRFGLLSADLTDDGATPKTATRTDQSHLFTGGVGLTW